MSELLLDAAGRRRSPATRPEFHAGRPPRNKGMRYLADPPTIEEIVTVMRHASDGVHGRRLRGLIVVLWRLATSSPPALVEVAAHEPGGERLAECSIHREAAMQARERPAPTARKSTHAASRRATPGRRMRKQRP